MVALELALPLVCMVSISKHLKIFMKYIFLFRVAKIAIPTQKGCRCNRG